MVDPVAIVARMLLVLGCGGAALMPSALDRSERVPASAPQVERPVIVPSASLVSTVSDAIVPEETSGDAAGEPNTLPPQILTPTPVTGIEVPEALRFSRAEQVRGSPVWLWIPSQDIEARIVPVGITGEGQMESPAAYDQVGWYRFGAYPGEIGRAVLAGHFDSQTGAAVFYELGALQPGDEVQVELSGGELAVFRVREVVEYPTSEAPLGEIFGHVDRPELVLITCAGEFQGPELGYSHRAIVYADPVAQ